MLWRFEMTTRKELSKINKLVEIIQKEKVISKVRLVMNSGISISYYEKLRPFIEEIYPHKVRYDKETKTWNALTYEEVTELDS